MTRKESAIRDVMTHLSGDAIPKLARVLLERVAEAAVLDFTDTLQSYTFYDLLTYQKKMEDNPFPSHEIIDQERELNP